jgi:hypothetical protein
LPETVEVPSMLKANELLPGVKDTANVVAKIPLFSIHVASDFDPISSMASTECEKRRAATASNMDIDERANRMVVCCYSQTQRRASMEKGTRIRGRREADQWAMQNERTFGDRGEGGVRRRTRGGRGRKENEPQWVDDGYRQCQIPRSESERQERGEGEGRGSCQGVGDFPFIAAHN